ncbi:putative inorganic phosphate cotransporter isoform X1 [Spodoptera frugiperda]|uniref:Inorganic phosphate cotransporter isoform X1 n=2 Tax=Spodoptera frugiperda TaxID=7108 RepID=A0A9R0D532_SPOFR|nr:putative inorganic phosphate cotransporter isoform X1 [Spodoptera frugiperda]
MAGRNVVYETVAKDEKHEELQKPPERPKGLGIRHLQTVILFICLTIAYTIRSQLSVLMVAMVRVQDPLCTLPDGTRNISEGCVDPNANISRWNIYRTYDWHKSTQEMITFSFFVGYTSMMIPMGLFAQKFGGKLPIMIALAVNGVISICTPWIALLGGWIAMSISRLALGMTQAAMYPSIHTLLAKWAPLRERGRLSTYIYTGSQAGTIIAFQLSGLFAGSPIFGWPVSFWLFGSLSLMSCALLGWLVVATPHQHPTITSEELAYIMEDGAVDIVPKKRKTPWKHILTSKPVWGLIVSHAGSAASYLLILTEIPIYMNHILHVDLKRNGLYSSLPYIALYLVALLFGYAADFAANRKIMSVVNIRRTANTIAMAGSGVFLFAFSFVNDTTWAVLVLIIAHGLHAGIHVGFHINQIDLAPNFAGPVMAVGNMIANLTSLLVPVIVSNIVKDDVTNHRKWQYVFMIFVAIMIISNAIFVWFAKGTVQPWNFYGEDENENGKELNSLEDKTTTNGKDNQRAVTRD